MHKELQGTYKGRMMIGQAGVYSVAAQLLMRGHVPFFPSVDTGVDILLENGVRLQVKTRSLQGHPAYPNGAYNFSVKDNNFGGRKRDWVSICDFLIYWGLDENRFFVVPSHEATQNFWIRPKGETKTCVSVDAMKVMRDSGMKYADIASALGVTDMTVIRNLKTPSKLNSPKGNRHLASFEDRWDLLSVTKVLEHVESVSTVLTGE